MSTSKGGRYLHMGPATVTFATGALEYVYGIEIRPTGNVVRAPDIENAAGPLDIRVSNRGLTVYIKDASVKATTVAAATGVASSRITVATAGGSTLAPDYTDTSVDIGGVSVSFTRSDGIFCRYYIKRAAKVPMFEAIKHGKSAFAEYAYAFETLDPADNTNVPWLFEDGVTT